MDRILVKEYGTEWLTPGSHVVSFESDPFSELSSTTSLVMSVESIGSATKEKHYVSSSGSEDSELGIPECFKISPSNNSDDGLARQITSSLAPVISFSTSHWSLPLDSRRISLEGNSQGNNGCVWQAAFQSTFGNSTPINSFMSNIFNYLSFNISIKENSFVDHLLPTSNIPADRRFTEILGGY